MRYYWIIYSITLLAYLFFNILWIDSEHTFPKKVKIIVTAGCMTFLSIALFAGLYSDAIPLWKFILVAPLSITFWATIVDFMIGIAFHGDPFYLSKNTWPDQQILRIVNNGYFYTIFKLAALIVLGGLYLHYV